MRERRRRKTQRAAETTRPAGRPGRIESIRVVPIMRPPTSAGPPSGLLLVLMCCPLLGLVQSASSNKAGDNGHPHLGDTDPERCMRHHFVETITHPIYKCNSKVRWKQTHAVV